jgi:hypothetical protein
MDVPMTHRSFVERLIDASLVRSKGAAAFKYQYDLAGKPPLPNFQRLARDPWCQHSTLGAIG